MSAAVQSLSRVKSCAGFFLTAAHIKYGVSFLRFWHPKIVPVSQSQLLAPSGSVQFSKRIEGEDEICRRKA
jgi:hypothetical protein